MKIHKGDKVVITAGSEKGKKGEVIKILSKTSRVVVGGVNIVTKHVKRTREHAGERIQKEAPIHVSNVMLECPETGKISRVGYSITKDGEKFRVAKKSGVTLHTSFKKS
jgi:large subunit ribosomal protein L24